MPFFTQLHLVLARRHRGAVQDELLSNWKSVWRVISTAFCNLPSQWTSTVISGLSSPLARMKSAIASMHDRRVAGRVPIGGVLAVIEQILHQPRGQLAFRDRSAHRSFR